MVAGLFVLLLLGPGFLTVWALKKHCPTVLESLFCSLFILSASWWFCEKFDSDPFLFLVWTVGLTAGSALVVGALVVFYRSELLIGFARDRDASSGLIRYGPILVLQALILAYLSVVGVYWEVPADILNHLESIQDTVKQIEKAANIGFSIWYFLLAFVAVVLDESVVNIVGPVTIVTSSIFLLGVREITLESLKEADVSWQHKEVIAGIAVLFMLTLFGTSVFSYVRYYSLAPTVLVLPLVWFTSLRIQAALVSTPAPGKWILVAILIFMGVCSTWTFHKQETLFLILLSVLIISVYSVSRVTQVVSASLYFQRLGIKRWIIVMGWIAIGMLIFTAVSGIHIESGVPKNTLLVSAFQKRLMFEIADPFGRVMETYGLVGLLGIVYYLIFISREHRNLAVLGWIVVPIIALFNPWFVGYFNEIADPTVLWRLAYITPIGVIAAYSVQSIVHQKAKTSRFKIWTGALLLLLCFLNPIMQADPYSRGTSLRTLHTEQTPVHWEDLVKFFIEQGEVNILSDPITGYMLASLTSVEHDRFKFHETESGSIVKREYSIESFKEHAEEGDWFFVLNLRDGGPSINGKRSGHWPENVLMLSTRYPTQLIRLLGLEKLKGSSQEEWIDTGERPPHFDLVWSRDRIWVFQLHVK